MDNATMLKQVDNWFTFHPVRQDQAIKYNAIRDAAKQFATVLAEMLPPDNKDSEQALLLVRQAVMMANAAIAYDQPRAQGWQIHYIHDDKHQPNPESLYVLRYQATSSDDDAPLHNESGYLDVTANYTEYNRTVIERLAYEQNLHLSKKYQFTFDIETLDKVYHNCRLIKYLAQSEMGKQNELTCLFTYDKWLHKK